MREGHEEENRKPCSDIDLYAMGLLEGEERERMERHIAGCSDCREELARIEELLGLLPLAAEPAEPPQGMRERVLGQVLGRPQADRLEEDAAERSEPALPPDVLRFAKTRTERTRGSSSRTATSVRRLRRSPERTGQSARPSARRKRQPRRGPGGEGGSRSERWPERQRSCCS